MTGPYVRYELITMYNADIIIANVNIGLLINTLRVFTYFPKAPLSESKLKSESDPKVLKLLDEEFDAFPKTLPITGTNSKL